MSVFNIQILLFNLYMNEDHKDEYIIKKIQSGDKDLYAVVIDRYNDKINRYVSRMTGAGDNATDIVQDVFIKAYINIQSFDTERKFNSWIYRIAHNECINHYKKKRPIYMSMFEFDTILPHFNNIKDPGALFVEKDDKERIEKVLDQVDMKYREVVVLYYFEDLDYKEISMALAIPISTVGVRMLRAKKILEKLLIDFNT